MNFAQANGPVVAEAPPRVWHAIRYEHPGAVAFSLASVPDDLRDELVTKRGGELLDAVALDVPDDLTTWPDGADAPEVVLCRSADDPRHFRVFKYRRDVRPPFVPENKNFFPIANWCLFAESLRRLEAIAAKAGPEETPEEWEALRRGLRESLGAGGEARR
jgi:hypothetical protein